jgi:hypothetical protein
LELLTLSYLAKEKSLFNMASSKLDHFSILNELSTFKYGHLVYITSEIHFQPLVNISIKDINDDTKIML